MSKARRDGMRRRDELLDAALECFHARGVLGTGIEEIRRAAGASPSSVYHQFDGMNGLIVALLERVFERLFAHLTARVVRTRTARGAVMALVDGHIEWILAQPKEGRFMYQATAIELDAALSESLAARKAHMLEPLLAHLAPFMRDGSLPRWSTQALDIVVLGPAHEALRRALAGGNVDMLWMRRQLPLLAWRCLGASDRT
ncbi:MAG: TetR family transcriptional regulator [Myxococcales bacterium]|nr:TetR family transcriptional regulator [Myxococcales bacterium]